MSVSVLQVANRDTHRESIAESMRRLRAEAQERAREHSEMLEQAIGELEILATDIAEGGEAYLGAVRETARRIGPELTNARLQLETILGRKGLKPS
jgi:hypothetical protein